MGARPFCAPTYWTSWMEPLIAIGFVAALGVLVGTVLFVRRGGITPLPGAGLTMAQRWRFMWLELAVVSVEVVVWLADGLGWALLLAGVLGWIPTGMRERARRK
ncbi:hypothetical protein [Streptomyces silvisoli]|uniref:DUF2516 family protein n=1 Tax=Streptomyces silvisoli TaxID=3034235 RepID=A0ABT5ZNL3_9ACTN|nr:hypothetical protein [Streptomyces silvisoli]MDF3291420.1 hypothetical protein [Streptomyces silvisoli]